MTGARTPHLVEDFSGRYWDGGHLPVDQAYAEDGYRYLSIYSAMCSDLECIWPVVIRRDAEGWRWIHLREDGKQRGAPHGCWQDAASDAVENGGAVPRR